MVPMMELRCGVDDIAELKKKYTLPMAVVDLGYDRGIIKPSTHCPFHDDTNPSFGIWEDKGEWKWKCHAG